MRTHSVCRSVGVALCFLAALTNAGHAEIFPIPGDFGWRKSVPLDLLKVPGVVADLELPTETARKLQELENGIHDELRAEVLKNLPGGPYAAAKDVPVQQRQRYSAEMRRVLAGKDAPIYAARNSRMEQINQLLTAQQQNRLHQIHVQRRGTDALSDSAVAKELGLTAGQQAQIYAIHEVVHRAEMNAVRLLQNRDKTGELEYQRLSQESTGKILAVLSDEQRRAFQDLQGKPLTK